MREDDAGMSVVLLEYDQGNEYLDEKACESCAKGTYIFDAATTVAGVYYAADPFLCQSCPDDNMAFDSTGSCACNDGYIPQGRTGLELMRGGEGMKSLDPWQ